MNIAIFGGSFDPYHEGHQAIVEKALQTLDIDKLFVVPTYLNPFKTTFYHDEITRLNNVKQKLKDFEKVEVLDYEVQQKRAVRTIETIKYLKNKLDLDKIYLIVGADNLKKLDNWYQIDEIKKLVTFVIATRDNIKVPNNFKKLEIKKDISSTKIRRQMKVEEIVQFLDQKKLENIEVFDMSKKDYIVDVVIIATILNDKHGFAVVDYLKPFLKQMGETHIMIEQSDNWSIVDTGDMLIHLMSSEYRAKYNIEEFLIELENKNLSI